MAFLIRMTGDWDLAEECAQDAFAQALVRWPRDGVPRRPGAWLTTTARNRALDRLRRRANEAVKVQEAMVITRLAESGDAEDDERHRRRPAAPDLHLLSPGAGHGGQGRADPAHRWPA